MNHNGRAGCSSEFIHQVSEVSLSRQATHAHTSSSSSPAPLQACWMENMIHLEQNPI